MQTNQKGIKGMNFMISIFSFWQGVTLNTSPKMGLIIRGLKVSAVAFLICGLMVFCGWIGQEILKWRIKSMSDLNESVLSMSLSLNNSTNTTEADDLFEDDKANLTDIKVSIETQVEMPKVELPKPKPPPLVIEVKNIRLNETQGEKFDQYPFGLCTCRHKDLKTIDCHCPFYEMKRVGKTKYNQYSNAHPSVGQVWFDHFRNRGSLKTVFEESDGEFGPYGYCDCMQYDENLFFTCSCKGKQLREMEKKKPVINRIIDKPVQGNCSCQIDGKKVGFENELLIVNKEILPEPGYKWILGVTQWKYMGPRSKSKRAAIETVECSCLVLNADLRREDTVVSWQEPMDSDLIKRIQSSQANQTETTGNFSINFY